MEKKVYNSDSDQDSDQDSEGEKETFEKYEEINMDITSIITIISDTSNDSTLGNKFGDISVWKSINKNIHEQICDELDDPILPKLNKIMEGKKLLVVRSAYDKTLELITTLGSDAEKARLQDFSKKLTIIEPNPSEYFKTLLNKSKIWDQMNVDIFGTSDTYGYYTLTANIKLINNLSERHAILNFEFQPHRSRCFVGVRYKESMDNMVALNSSEKLIINE